MRFNVRFNQTSQTLDIKFVNNNNRFDTKFKTTGEQFEVIFKGFQEVNARFDAEYYEGEYEATPMVTEQTLDTSEKLMTEDFTIKAIPYFEVSNLAGGSTVTIGGN